MPVTVPVTVPVPVPVTGAQSKADKPFTGAVVLCDQRPQELQARRPNMEAVTLLMAAACAGHTSALRLLLRRTGGLASGTAVFNAVRWTHGNNQ